LNIVFIFSQPILRIVTLKNDAQRPGLSAVLIFRDSSARTAAE